METLTVNICFASVVLPNKPTASPRPSDLGSWDVRNKEFTDKLSADEFLRGELDGRSCAVFDYIEWARNAWISSWFVKNQDLGSNPAEVSSFKVMSSKEVQSGVWSCAKLCVFFSIQGPVAFVSFSGATGGLRGHCNFFPEHPEEALSSIRSNLLAMGNLEAIVVFFSPWTWPTWNGTYFGLRSKPMVHSRILRMC